MNYRYTLLIVFLSTLLFSSLINAQVLYNMSDATFSAGNLSGQNGWVFTGSSTATPIQVITSTMTYPSLPYGVGPSALQFGASGEDDNHPFTAVTSGSVYCSFLVQVSSVPAGSAAAPDYFIHFGDGTSTNFWARTLIRSSVGNNFDFGISKGSTATSTAAFTNQVLALNTTYLIVIKYTYNTGSTTDDECDLFLNPSVIGFEPAPTAAATVSTATDPTTISTINLRQGGASTSSIVQVSDIRVGTTWANAPMPVELTSFTAAVSKNAVNLKWSTATELNNSGFGIERSGNKSEWTKLGFVSGKGNSNTTKNYSYADNSVSASGKYYYRLKQVDNDGTYKYSNTTEVNFAAPSVFSLNQNYPNPFNPSTIIAYSIPNASNVKLMVFNEIAQVVKVIEDGYKEAGNYNISFNASNMPSGLYFYKIEAGQFSQIRKMMLVK